MSPTAIRAHDRVDTVRGRVAITRGPLVYCLEQADLPAGVAHDDISLIGMPVATTDTVLDVPVTPRMHARVRADAGGLYRESVADSVESESRDLEVTGDPVLPMGEPCARSDAGMDSPGRRSLMWRCDEAIGEWS